jgi:hypothetical protein
VLGQPLAASRNLTRSARVSARVVEYVGAQRRRYAAKARARKRGERVPSNGAGEVSQDCAAMRFINYR